MISKTSKADCELSNGILLVENDEEMVSQASGEGRSPHITYNGTYHERIMLEGHDTRIITYCSRPLSVL